MVYNEHFDDTLDELANQKARNLAVRLVSDDIVENLSHAKGENYAQAGITVNDYLGKMYLDSGKGNADTTEMAQIMIDTNYPHVTKDNKAIQDLTVEKCYAFVETQSNLIMEEHSELKADFSLYNTFSFLTDDMVASIEVISEGVGLGQSHIADRFTRTLVNTDLY